MLMLMVVLMLMLDYFMCFVHHFGCRLAMAGNDKSAIAAHELLGRMQEQGRPIVRLEVHTAERYQKYKRKTVLIF